jgi:hypothetical protein
MDKLFGSSTNWIRFVDAATKIETLLGRFRIEWYKTDTQTVLVESNKAASVNLNLK